MNKLICIFFLTPLLASLPTVESLFRNGNNRDIELNTGVLEFGINKINNDSLTDEKEEVENKVVANNNFFIKLIFFKDKNDRYDFIQLVYNEKKEKLLKMFQSSSYLRMMKNKKETFPEQDLFYGMVNSLVLNDSSILSSFFKKVSNDFKSNKEIINTEKLAVYEKYKRYLQTITDEPNLAAELESPLKPSGEEERATMKETMSGSFYNKTNQVELIKRNDEFVIKLTIDKVRAHFKNTNHRMIDFIYEDPRGPIIFNFHDFILFNGVHEIPRNIIFNINSDTYSIKVKELKYFTFQKKSFLKRLDFYKKEHQQSTTDVNQQHNYPHFLL